MMVTGCKGFNSVGCEVKVWDIRNPSQSVYNLLGHSQDVTDCCFVGNNIFSVSKDGSIGLWGLADGIQTAWKPANGNQAYTCVASRSFSNNNNIKDSFMTVGSFDGALHKISINLSEVPFNQINVSSYTMPVYDENLNAIS